MNGSVLKSFVISRLMFLQRNPTRVSQWSNTKCTPSVELRTCRFGRTLKFPHIKLNGNRAKKVWAFLCAPRGPLPTHNKHAGKRTYSLYKMKYVRAYTYTSPTNFTSYCRSIKMFMTD